MTTAMNDLRDEVERVLWATIEESVDYLTAGSHERSGYSCHVTDIVINNGKATANVTVEYGGHRVTGTANVSDYSRGHWLFAHVDVDGTTGWNVEAQMANTDVVDTLDFS